jgi:hypothetical protein
MRDTDSFMIHRLRMKSSVSCTEGWGWRDWQGNVEIHRQNHKPHGEWDCDAVALKSRRRHKVGSIEGKPGVSGENVHTPNSVTSKKKIRLKKIDR